MRRPPSVGFQLALSQGSEVRLLMPQRACGELLTLQASVTSLVGSLRQRSQAVHKVLHSYGSSSYIVPCSRSSGVQASEDELRLTIMLTIPDVPETLGCYASGGPRTKRPT